MSEPKYPAARTFAGRLEAHFARDTSPRRGVRASAGAGRGSHRGPDRRGLLGEPAARGGLRARRSRSRSCRRSGRFGRCCSRRRCRSARARSPSSRRPSSGPGSTSACGAQAGELVVWGTTRAIPAFCFVLEVVAPGLLVVKHRIREDSRQVPQRRRVRGRAGQDPEPAGRGRARTIPSCSRSLLEPESSAGHGRARRPAAAARGVDAGAQARRDAARGSRGERGVARVDRAADRLRGGAARSRSSAISWSSRRRTAMRRTTGRSAGSWTPSPA